MSTVACTIGSLPSPGLLLPTHRFQGPPIDFHQGFTQLPSTLCGLHYLCCPSALLWPGATSTYVCTSAHCLSWASPPIPCQFPSTLCPPMAGEPLKTLSVWGFSAPFRIFLLIFIGILSIHGWGVIKNPSVGGPMLLALHVCLISTSPVNHYWHSVHPRLGSH